MTLILGAMDGELAATVQGLESAGTTAWNGFPIHHGSIAGHKVAVAKTGVGKSLSAMFCQHLIDTLSPVRVLFTGIAGFRLEIGPLRWLPAPQRFFLVLRTLAGVALPAGPGQAIHFQSRPDIP